MSTTLKDLKTACSTATASPDSRKIADGAAVWIVGNPVHAEAGFIGLSMGDGHSMIVSEESILEVKKDESRYLVRVKEGTAALVRSEGVVTLRDTGSPCSCSGESSPTSAARSSGGGFGAQDSRCSFTCHWWNMCNEYHAKDGTVQRVCVPALMCGWHCSGDVVE